MDNTKYPTARMPRNYDFVSFPESANTKYMITLDRRKGDFSGSIGIRLTAVDDLIIMLPEQTEHLFITGSAVKGAVRHVARAISDGCIVHSEKDRLRLRREHRGSCVITPRNGEPFHVCMVCDMFGGPGLAAKLIFSELTADCCELAECRVPIRHQPYVNAPFYMEDGFHRGYKFYLTECAERESDDFETVTAVKSGSIFSGTILFGGLHEDELSLLLYALGIASGEFSHKLGGYRADGFGTVNFTCTEFSLNGRKLTVTDAESYGRKYTEICGANCLERIEQLRSIMKYKHKNRL